MSEEQQPKRIVRFQFNPDATPEEMAQAIRDYCKKLREQREEKQT